MDSRILRAANERHCFVGNKLPPSRYDPVSVYTDILYACDARDAFFSCVGEHVSPD